MKLLFLSYNASMSDALESIYRAACADAAVEATWLPIPYAERAPDHSIVRWSLDGPESYPDDLVCADWQRYDIASERPDVIFSFAPYDDRNLTTVVHPDYHFERLRDLTACLVYVPYFVTAEEVEEKFCILPACMYADRVFLESEAVRVRYVEVFARAFGDRYGVPEEKFVALGSPKYDKVLATTRESAPVPAELAGVLASRRVVLFNTSLSAALHGGVDSLQKLIEVVQEFRHRDDLILWWRPHPLLRSTYASMRPELLDAYDQIVAAIRSGDVPVIVDEGPHLHRAIAWSDAYYGDPSSVSLLYLATGKPLMQSNIEAVAGHPRAWVGPFDPVRFFRDPELLVEWGDWRECLYYEWPDVPLSGFLDYLATSADSQNARDLVVARRRVFRSMVANADGTAGVAILGYVLAHLDAAGGRVAHPERTEHV